MAFYTVMSWQSLETSKKRNIYALTGPSILPFLSFRDQGPCVTPRSLTQNVSWRYQPKFLNARPSELQGSTLPFHTSSYWNSFHFPDLIQILWRNFLLDLMSVKNKTNDNRVLQWALNPYSEKPLSYCRMGLLLALEDNRQPALKPEGCVNVDGVWQW